MGAGDKTINVTVKTLADISDVTNKAKEIQESLNKIQLPQKLKTSLETTFGNLYKEVEKASEALQHGFKTKGDVTKYERSIETINGLLTKLYTNIQNIDSTKLEIKVDSNEFQQLEAQIKQLKSGIAGINTTEIQKLTSLLKEPPSGAKAWNDFLTAISASETDFDTAEKALARLDAQVEKHKTAINAGDDSWKKYKETVDQMHAGLERMKENVSSTTEAIKHLEQQQEQMHTDAFKRQAEDIDRAKTSMHQLSDEARIYGKETVEAAQSTQRLGSELDQFKSRIAYFFGLNNAVRLLQRAFRSAYTTVQELDKALTETAVVTNYTVQDMWGKIPEYTDRANKLGVTILDVAKASTLYYQQGLKVNEVNAVTTSTLKMARIAGLDAAEATDRMTNALRGFNMEINETSAERVADVYSKLAAMSASNVDEISTAMTKVASLAHNANMDFETTSAFLAQIIETTRESAETAGTALKTVVARFSEVKSLYSQGELLGTDEEGEVIDVNKVSKALRTAGINLNEYLTGMKGLDDIFMELASKWDNLDAVQQRYIATMAAGSRQQSRFIAMMQDYQRTTELVSAAQNAAGASQQQYQKTLDSLESKLNKLKNSWNDFITAIINQGAVKFIVDALRTLFDIINKITNILPGATSGIAKFFVAFAGFKLGRNVVKQMFAGTKIAEMFMKQGELANKGFIKGFVNKASLASINSYNQALDTYVVQKNLANTATLNGITSQEVAIGLDKLEEETTEAKTAAIMQYSAITGLSNEQAEAAILLRSAEVDADLANAAAQGGLTTARIQELKAEMVAAGYSSDIITQRLTETATIYAEKAATEGNTKSLWKNISTRIASIATIAAQKIPLIGNIAAWITEKFAIEAATAATIAFVGVATVGLGIIIAVAAVITNQINKSKQLAEATEQATNAAKEATDKYKNLKTALEEIEEKKQIVSQFTEGTTQWKDAVKDLNEQVLKLVETYPKLAKYLTYNNGKFELNEAGTKEVEDESRADAIGKLEVARSTAVNEKQNKRYSAKELNNLGLKNGEDTFIGYAFKNWQKTGETDLFKYAEEHFNGVYSDASIARLQAIFDGLIQETSEKVDSAIFEMNKFILENNDYGENSGIIYDYLKNTNYTPDTTDYTTREQNANRLNTALKGDYGDLIKKIISGEEENLTKVDVDLLKNPKVVEQVAAAMNVDASVIEGFRDKADQILNTFENTFTDYFGRFIQTTTKVVGMDETTWEPIEETTTSAAWVDKLNATNKDALLGMSTGNFNIIQDFINAFGEDLSDSDLNAIIYELTHMDLSDADAINGLITKFSLLDTEIEGDTATALDLLITKLKELNAATSQKATAANLIKNIDTQTTIMDTVTEGDELDSDQYALARSAGAPEDAFVYTGAGWVYTGDPEDLVQKFKTANVNMFNDAALTYQNEPTEANRQNVNQMASTLGASGQNIDISQFQGYDTMYDQSFVTQEGNDALNEYSKGLIAAAEGNEELYLKQKQLEKEMKTGTKETQSEARALMKLGIEEQEAQKKFDKLNDTIEDNVDILKDGDKNSTEYKVALSKIGDAMSEVFGQDFDEEFLTDPQNLADIQAFAEGDEEAFERLQKTINDRYIESMKNAVAEGTVAQEQLEGIQLAAEALNDTNFEIDGEADFSDVFNQLIAIYGDAESTAAAIEALGGYQVTWDPYEDENGNISYKAKVTNTMKNAQKKNLGGGGKSKSGGGGSKEKEKYWDNPYDELYNLLEAQNELLRTREKLEREYDRILQKRSSTAQELKQNSLDEIANLQKELDIQRQIQEGRVRMMNELGAKGTYRDEEGNEKTFNQWGVTKYGGYDSNTGQMWIDWNEIDKVNDPELGGAIEAYISKLEELSESFEETQETIEEMKDLIREIKERNMQEYLEFEERVYEAIIDREQKVIDEYSALSDTISESNSRIVDSLRESIDLERQIRDNTKTEEDIADKEARLAYLQRDTSGANQQEILKLQQELDDARQSYGDTLIDQAIDQLEQENQKAEEQRQQQIEIMQAQLDWQKENGEFWDEVYTLINASYDDGMLKDGSPLANLLKESDAFKGMSEFGQKNWMNELVDEWKKAYEGLINWQDQEELENGSTQTTIEEETKAPATPAPAPTAPAPVAQTTTEPQYDTYTVQRGDNLSRIAAKYGTTWQKLYDFNKDTISNPNMIYVGQKIKIPKYAQGGLVNGTGLAWLDGTKSSPELVLSAADTENFIALKNALAQMLAQSKLGGKAGGDNYFDIQINVDELANDYDVDQLAARIKKQIYDDSTYRNVNAISYIR